MRIAIGLAFISVTVILAAALCGIVPNRRGAVIDGRKMLCEVLSVGASIHARDHEFKRMEAALRAAVKRNEDILSAAVRLRDGNGGGPKERIPFPLIISPSVYCPVSGLYQFTRNIPD